jgi:NitT/TauT family transport system ATP-binding protein
MGLIELSGVSKRFTSDRGDVEALRDVDLDVPRGQFVSLLGPSGCGKSTLLRIIGGLQPASSGAVTVTGRQVSGPVPDVGFMFQSSLLLRWRRVLDNVLLPAEMAGLSRRDHAGRARELLAMVGLEEFHDRYPHELSGGMQQRVALCRALLLDQPILLMDEPFGALDAMTRDEMNLELARMVEGVSASGHTKTVVFVTHSIPEAVFLSDRIYVMSARPGQIDAAVDVPLPRPRDLPLRGTEEFGRLTMDLYERMNAQFSGSVRD